MRRTLVAVVVTLAAACGPEEPPVDPGPNPPAVAGVCVPLEPDNARCPFEGQTTYHWKLGYFGSDGLCRANIALCGGGAAQSFGATTECSSCQECEAVAGGSFVVHLPNGGTTTTCGQ